MEAIVTYRYLFFAIGGRVSHDWHVNANYEYNEYPALDLEGDQANMPDVSESLTVKTVNDFTAGFDAGEIKSIDIPDEHISGIIETGLRAGRKLYEQRKRNSTSTQHPN